MVTVLRTFAPLTDLKFSNAAMMREIGLLARELIVRRTMAGQDATGASFQPYSAKYAEGKAKELGSAEPVNLTVSGGMLRNLQIVEVTENSVTLGWTS
jgi:hypothetical protein